MDRAVSYGKIIDEQQEESGRQDRTLWNTTVDRLRGRTVTIYHS